MSTLSYNRRFYLLALRRRPLQQPSAQSRFQSSEAALGLRSHLPPDTGPPDPKTPRQISDQEWEIRTGRAIFLIQETLPEFFSTGLVSSIDAATGNPRRAISNYLPVANANPLDYLSGVDQDMDSIYSPNIRLSYTPPVELPAPFPKTLNIEGAPLYFTSSIFVKHTLNALYSDLKVVLNNVSVNTPPVVGDTDVQMLKSRRKSREKSLFVGLGVSGIARVSGAPGDWEVNSTYTFSPLTGLIHLHTVNSIHPAPHQTVYHALRASLGNIFGEPSRPGGAAGAISKTGDPKS